MEQREELGASVVLIEARRDPIGRAHRMHNTTARGTVGRRVADQSASHPAAVVTAHVSVDSVHGTAQAGLAQALGCLATARMSLVGLGLAPD